MNIAEYLASRADEPLDPIRTSLLAAQTHLDAAGVAIDALVRRGEAAQDGEIERRNVIEETVQTLNALSREVWGASRGARETLRALAQLPAVERRLVLSVAANDAMDVDEVQALDDARASLRTIENAIAAKKVLGAGA